MLWLEYHLLATDYDLETNFLVLKVDHLVSDELLLLLQLLFAVLVKSQETMEKLKIAFNKDSISVTPNGILDNLDLHYPNEAARHKLLDVIGDLALIGMKIRGKVIAEKPGHSINAKFAEKVSEVIKSVRKNTLPKIDFEKN